jgi:hypothetical protein
MESIDQVRSTLDNRNLVATLACQFRAVRVVLVAARPVLVYPISGHISRLSWFENEPHAGRAFALEVSLVWGLRFHEFAMAFERVGGHDQPSGA